MNFQKTPQRGDPGDAIYEICAFITRLKKQASFLEDHPS